MVINYKLDKSQQDRIINEYKPILKYDSKGHFYQLEDYTWKSWEEDSTNYAYLLDVLLKRFVIPPKGCFDAQFVTDKKSIESIYRKEYPKIRSMLQRVHGKKAEIEEKCLGDKLIQYWQEHKKLLKDPICCEEDFVREFYEQMEKILGIGKEIIPHNLIIDNNSNLVRKN